MHELRRLRRLKFQQQLQKLENQILSYFFSAMVMEGKQQMIKNFNEKRNRMKMREHETEEGDKKIDKDVKGEEKKEDGNKKQKCGSSVLIEFGKEC